MNKRSQVKLGKSLLVLFVFLGIVLLGIFVMGAIEGPNSPGTMADDSTIGTITWSSPDNAKASDYSRSEADHGGLADVSHYLKATNFGFSIPGGSIIDGILVEIEMFSGFGAQSSRENEIKILKSDGSIGTTNKSTGSALPTSEQYVPFGGSSDLWDETWESTDINDVDFGVVLSTRTVEDQSGTAKVDHIRITVYYTPITIDSPQPDQIFNATYGQVDFNITTGEMDTCYWSDHYDCYQESANVSTACGGLDTGVYELLGASDSSQYDGDFGTFDTDAGMLVNYTKPSESLGSSKWKVKDSGGTVNLTIDSNCWNQDFLQFRVRDFIGPTLVEECHNGTEWVVLRTVFEHSGFYEEAMFWDFGDQQMTKESSTKFGAINTTLEDSSHNIKYFCNVTDGTWRESDNVTFTSDFNFPNINFTNPTTSASNFSQDWIFANISITDLFILNNATINLYNSTDLVNSTSITSLGNCYQESANVSTACGGLSTGVYWNGSGWTDIINASDGNYSTSSFFGSSTGTYNFYVNYTIPPNSLSSSVWQTKLEESNRNTFTGYCFNSSSDWESLFVQDSDTTILQNHSLLDSCFYDDTLKLRLEGENILTSTIGKIYEEAMIWQFNESSLSINFTGLSDNTYYLNATTYDSVNNINSTETRTIILDTTPPATTETMTSPPDGNPYTNGTWTANNVKVTMITTDSGVGFDNLAFPKYCTDTTNTCNPNTYISSGAIITTEGVSYMRFNASDLINNAETINSRTIKIDTGNPNVTITYPTSGLNLSFNTSINLNFTRFDALTNVSSCEYSINNGNTNTTISNCQNTTFKAPEGSVTIYLYANDSVGNLNHSESITFTIDLTNPDINITSPINASNSSDSGLDINFTRSDTNLESCWYHNDTKQVNVTLASCGNITGVTWSEGNHNVTVWANDSAGNVNSSIIFFRIDTINPNITYDSSTTTNNTFRQTGDIFINVTAEDLNKEVVKFEWNGVNETFDSISGDFYSENQTGLTEGSYRFYAWINDSSGNFNRTSQRNITIDLNNPSVTISSPKPQSYASTNISFNYTVTDKYLDTCWFTNDTGVNNFTLPNCQNTSINMSEGTHTIILYANDSSGRESSDSVTFVISLAPPTISLDFPSDNQWLNYSQNVNFNYTASDTALDSCELHSNFTGTFGLNQTDASPNNGTTSTFLVNLIDGNYSWNVQCNNSGNNFAWGSPLSNLTIKIDTIYPLISFSGGTITNGTNSTSTNISVTVDVTEINERNITFRLYNDVGSYNISNFTDGRRTIDWLDLPDDNYFVNVTITDFAGNLNTTETIQINLDDTKPIITIDQPKAQNYANNDTMGLNYTVTDNLVGLDECWYNVINSSNDIIISTTILSSCENTTFKVPGGDIDYTLLLFAKDFLSNTQSSSVTFGIRTESPAISLSPGNDTHKNYLNNHYLNFSVTTNADSISSCSLYHNITGTFELNQTKSSPSEGITNSFVLNLSEIQFLWNVNCSDNFGTFSWGLNNQTYIVDLTNPNLNIISITTTAGSQTFTTENVITDTYLDSCKYSIFDSSGNIDGLSENVSFTCNSNFQATTTSFQTYNMTIYAEDKATNENSSSQMFTISTAPPGGGGGGGGTTESITVIAIIKPNESSTLVSDLNRAVIYSRINDLCLDFSTSSSTCILNEATKNTLINKLKEQGVNINSEELDLWIENYNKNEIENVDVPKTSADRFDLDKFTIIFEEPPFRVSPPSLSPFFIITSKDSIFEFTVQSAEPLADVQLVEGEVGLSIEKDITTAIITYKSPLFPPPFTTKIISGVASYTSEKGEVVFQKIQIRAIYVKSPILIIILIIFIGGGIFIFIFRDNLNKTLKKVLKKLK